MPKIKDTKCWTCSNVITNGCSWARAWEPVDGWTAEKHKLSGYNDEMRESYMVIDCPLYEDDRPTEKPVVSIDAAGSYWCRRCNQHLRYGVKMCPACESAYLDWTGIRKFKRYDPVYTGDGRRPKHLRVPGAEPVILRADVIKERLKELGYKSLTQFALDCGINRNTIAKAMNETCKRSTAERIAAALGLFYEDIFKCRYIYGMKKEACYGGSED